MLSNCKKIIVVKNNKNVGVAKAWNQGLKVSKAEYFLITNNDIVFRNDSINNLLKFQRKTSFGMVTAIDTKRCFNQDYLSFQIRDEEWAGLCWSCFMLREKTIKSIGYFDENFFPAYLEDQDFEHRLNLVGIKKCSTFMSVIRHDEGATGRGNNWKLSPDCDTHTKLYYHAYVKNKNYFADKYKLGNKYNRPIPQ